MNDEDAIKNLHLYEDEEAIQKTIHYLELQRQSRIRGRIPEIHAAVCTCC